MRSACIACCRTGSLMSVHASPPSIKFYAHRDIPDRPTNITHCCAAGYQDCGSFQGFRGGSDPVCSLGCSALHAAYVGFASQLHTPFWAVQQRCWSLVQTGLSGVLYVPLWGRLLRTRPVSAEMHICAWFVASFVQQHTWHQHSIAPECFSLEEFDKWQTPLCFLQAALLGKQHLSSSGMHSSQQDGDHVIAWDVEFPCMARTSASFIMLAASRVCVVTCFLAGLFHAWLVRPQLHACHCCCGLCSTCCSWKSSMCEEASECSLVVSMCRGWVILCRPEGGVF